MIPSDSGRPGVRARARYMTSSPNIEDARVHEMLAPDIGTTATVEAICALARGLSERAGTLSPKAYGAMLGSAKKLIRGTLFKR